jgi:hypothetical protein
VLASYWVLVWLTSLKSEEWRLYALINVTNFYHTTWHYIPKHGVVYSYTLGNI